MIEKDVVVPNLLGLHARAAAKLVHTASGFKSKVQIVKDHQVVNGKSILGILLLAAGQGTQLRLLIEGPDEQAAAKAVSDLIANGFGEDTGSSAPKG